MAKKKNPGVDDDASSGIWYYVWLPKTGWWLYMNRDPNSSHWEAWGEKIAPLLIKDWKIKKSLHADVRRLQHSLPRGRVAETKAGEFLIAHGNDFPSGLNKESELDKIISAFGLTRRHLIGQASAAYWKHETMNEAEKLRLMEIIGPIKY
jgi:hypothetical protein